MSGRADTLDTLVRMANQIARFFESQGHEPGALGMADHLATFWTPRMREDIQRHADAGGEGLLPLAVAALAILRKRAAPELARALEDAGGVSVATERGSDAG